MIHETRPGEIGRLEAQKIAKETASLLQLADNERDFREYMLVSQAEMRLEIKQVIAWQSRHEAEDTRRFGEVNQSIGGTISGKTVALAISMIAAVAACIAFVVWIVREVAKP